MLPANYWNILVNPADILPALYHRLPEAQPYPTSPMHSPEHADSKRYVHAAAREVHALHFKVWDSFAWKLRQILQPHPSLAAAALAIIHEANGFFIKPLEEIGWKPKPA